MINQHEVSSIEYKQIVHSTVGIKSSNKRNLILKDGNEPY